MAEKNNNPEISEDLSKGAWDRFAYNLEDIFSKGTIIASLIGLVLLLVAASGYLSGYWSIFSKEVGFAFLVSVIVGILVERRHRRRWAKDMDARMEQMANNVFSGVFRSDLPDELVSEAIDLTFKAKVIREDFDLSYRLVESTYTDHQGKELEHIMVEAEARFRLRSIAGNEKPVEVGVVLPDPQVSSLREKVEVTHFEVNGQVIEDLEQRNHALQDELFNNGQLGDVAFIGAEIDFSERGRTADVRACYRMAKEIEDTEVVRSLYPSKGVTLTVFDPSGGKRAISAHPIHPGGFDAAPDIQTNPGVYTWRLKRYLLPQQGIMFWWKLADRSVNRPKAEPEQA